MKIMHKYDVTWESDFGYSFVTAAVADDFSNAVDVVRKYLSERGVYASISKVEKKDQMPSATPCCVITGNVFAFASSKGGA